LRAIVSRKPDTRHRDVFREILSRKFGARHTDVLGQLCHVDLVHDTQMF